MLERIYRGKFLDCNYAFQKGKSALKAIKKFEKNKKEYVFKADIEDFFDPIDHKILLSVIRRDVKDRDLLSLIEKFVKVKYIDRKEVFRLKRGVPLGNALSGLLANIYLNDLDKLMRNSNYIRYADDMIVVSNSREELLSIKHRIQSFLSKRKLRLNEEKTKIVRISEGVIF